jgi:4'-phosphopantetheinyl transferase
MSAPSRPIPSLAAGVCHVWWATPADAGPRVARLLSSEDHRRYLGYRRPADSDRFMVGAGLIRLVLSGYLAATPAQLDIIRRCPRCGEPHGKPTLSDGSGIHFSVSHREGLVVAAFLLDSAVGIDIERVRQAAVTPGVAELTLTARELDAWRKLDESSRVAAFFRTWTRKEAVVKAAGRGLETPLHDVEVSGSGQPPAVTRWPAADWGASEVSLHDLSPTRGYVGSLAVLGPPVEISSWDGSSLLAGV